MLEIKLRRLNAGLTQAEFAELLGVTRGTIANWEKGRWQPSIKALNTLSKLFGCNITELINMKGSDKCAD